jgi:hypothetical protein
VPFVVSWVLSIVATVVSEEVQFAKAVISTVEVPPPASK